MTKSNPCSASANQFDQVQALYTELALQPNKDFGWGKGRENSRQLGYADDWLQRLPDTIWESAAAVGNPFSVGPLHTGEFVVDLGCGAGADACVAALLVGQTGRVYGVDATPAMIDKATRNAMIANLPQVEFHCADMSKLSLPDGTADVVISNGAINLTLDKAKVFAEVFRVIKPTGRFQFADIVREQGTSACCSTSEPSWADCVAGTLSVEEIMKQLLIAGFGKVELVGLTGYKTSGSTIGALFRAMKPG